MKRTTIGVILGLALMFGALPALMAFSFGGSSGSNDEGSTVLETPAPEFRIAGQDHPLAFGTDGSAPGSGCPYADDGDTSGL